LPADHVAEIAFAGRSNAGKSSLINHLTKQSGLAKVSQVPGKTRDINLYNIENDAHQVLARMIDLPGYGYAKVSKAMQESWQKELAAYLYERQNLAVVIVIMDARHPLTDLDQLVLQILRQRSLTQILVFNKVDKLNQSEKSRLSTLMQQVQYQWPNSYALSYSSHTNVGRDALIKQISHCMNLAMTSSNELS
jgi:GTP-binding protein